MGTNKPRGPLDLPGGTRVFYSFIIRDAVKSLVKSLFAGAPALQETAK